MNRNAIIISLENYEQTQVSCSIQSKVTSSGHAIIATINHVLVVGDLIPTVMMDICR